MVNGLHVLLQASLLPEFFVAKLASFGHYGAVKPEVSGVALLLQRQPADGAGRHLGGDPEVTEHVAHQGFVVFEGFITDGAHLKLKEN